MKYTTVRVTWEYMILDPSAGSPSGVGYGSAHIAEKLNKLGEEDWEAYAVDSNNWQCLKRRKKTLIKKES